MKQIEQTIQAVKDWSKNLIDSSIHNLASQVDADSILRKTGDASSVIAKFNRAASRSNLISGDTLDASLGKISKYFYDLKSVAFSGSYSDLSGRPNIPNSFIKNFYLTMDCCSASQSWLATFNSRCYSSPSNSCKRIALVIHVGGGSTTTKYGSADRMVVWAVVPRYVVSGDYTYRYTTVISLGSSGSTSRGTVANYTTTTIGTSGQFKISIPKGSWGEFTVYTIPLLSDTVAYSNDISYGVMS